MQYKSQSIYDWEPGQPIPFDDLYGADRDNNPVEFEEAMSKLHEILTDLNKVT